MTRCVHQYSPFRRDERGRLAWMGRDLAELADTHATPTLVYSAQRLASNVAWIRRGFDAAPRELHIALALKSCGHASLASACREAGSLVEVTSLAEMSVARAAGFSPAETVVNGLGWPAGFLEALVEQPPFLVNIDNEQDGQRLSAAAVAAGTHVPVGVRVVPDVDGGFAALSSKLGTPIFDGSAARLVTTVASMPGLQLVGVSAHVLHRCSRLDPLREAADSVVEFVLGLAPDVRARLRVLDLGGGLDDREILEREGIDSLAIAGEILSAMARLDRSVSLLLEPGRLISGDAAVMLSTVVTRKPGRPDEWLIVDAGTNALVPIPAAHFETHALADTGERSARFAIADGICSPDSVIEHAAMLPRDIGPLDVLAIGFCGAYTLALGERWGYELPSVVLLGPEHDQVLVSRGEALADYLGAWGVRGKPTAGVSRG